MTTNGETTGTIDGYIRVSRVGDRSGKSYISPTEQRRMIEEGAKRAGVELGLVVEEENVSGSKAARDRRLEELLVRAEAGESDGIIVAWQDRLSRGSNRETAELWERLEAARARLIAVGDGVDSASSGSEWLFTIKGMVARDQWKRYRQNWQDAKRNAIERGKFIGPVPVGYLKDEDGRLIPAPESADLVRSIFTQRIDGKSWATIARWTAEQGRPLSQSGVARIVTNPVYLGHSKQGQAVNTDAHQPLVSRLDFDRANAAQRTSSYKGKTGRTAGRTLAQGLATCAICALKLQVKVNNGYLAFECKNPHCGGNNISARKLDGELTSRIFDLLELEAEHPIGPLVHIKSRSDPSIIAQAEKQLAEAEYDLQLWQDNTDALRTLGQARYNVTLEKRVQTVDQARAALDLAIVEHSAKDQIFMLDEAWENWTVEERRDTLRKIIRQVLVFPAKIDGQPLTTRARVQLELVDGRQL